MSNDELISFAERFLQDILTGAEATGKYSEEYFFEKYAETLIDSGEINETVNVMYRGPLKSGIQVDGYGGDPAENEDTLSLIICDFSHDSAQSRLTRSDMDTYFRRLMKFIEKARESKWRNSLEETSPAFELASVISLRWKTIYKVRLFLISNRQLSDRVDGLSATNIDNKKVTHSVWDMRRYFQFDSNGQGREEIEIDLERDYGGSVAVLPAQQHESKYKSYLTILPGEVLAKIYERYRSRLLEQNVRVFLQARGKVNKGIRTTLEKEPSMFFAYNNGISATAEEVEIENAGDRFKLRRLKNFQIVNGGQTTASIHHAFRSKHDLKQIYVQMKLSVIDNELTSIVVPKISEFANSQNRVSASDFFSNHEFHIRIENFSRQVYAPSPEGEFRGTKWFYERAKGQYAEARSYLTRAERKKFDLENPRSQLISKTDLAKFLNVWKEEPHLVSKGAQTNFMEFAKHIEQEWNQCSNSINEEWYRDAIAKAIIFRSTEKIVSNQSWYQGGYRANIVAYTISKLAFETRERKLCINLQNVWRQQSLSQNLVSILAMLAEAVHRVLTSPIQGFANVTQWAKKEICWKRIKEQKIQWDPKFDQAFISIDEKSDIDKRAKKEQEELIGIEAQTTVINAGQAFWLELQKWGRESRTALTSKEANILTIATQIPNRIPSAKQSEILIKVFNKFSEQGFDKQLPTH